MNRLPRAVEVAGRPFARAFSCALIGAALLVFAASPSSAQEAPRSGAPAPTTPPATANPNAASDPNADNPAAGLPDRAQRVFRGWPLLTVERGPGARREIDAFFSLYNRVTDGADSVTTRFAPFYWASESADGSQSALLPFYFWTSNSRSTDFRSLLFAYSKHENGSSWWQAPWPLYVYQSTKDSTTTTDRIGLWPFLDVYGRQRSGQASSTELLGLGAWGRPGESFFPFFRHRVGVDGNRQQTRLFPIFHYSEGTATDPGSLFVLPLLGYASWEDEDSEGRLMLPLLGLQQKNKIEEESRTFLLLGLFENSRGPDYSRLRVEPLFGYEDSPEKRSWHLLRLLGQERNDAENFKATLVLPPLGRFASSETGYSHRFAPFYFAGGQTLPGGLETSYQMLLPFYYDRQTPRESRRLVFPLYYSSESPRKERRVVLPLFWQSRDDDREHFHLLPIYSHYRDRGQSTRALLGPLYVHHSEPAGFGDAREHHSLLWPLLSYGRGPDYRHSHVLPLWWSTRDRGEEFDLLAPLYLRTKSDNVSQFYLVPFYGQYDSTDADGSKLLRRFYAGAALTNTEVHYASPEGGVDKRWHVLGPLAGWSSNETTGSSHSRLLPVWWQNKSRLREDSLLLPLYYTHRSRGEFEYNQNPNEWSLDFTSVLGPLWVDHRTPQRRIAGALFPLSLYRKGYLDGETSLDVLGVYSSRSKELARSWRLTPFVQMAHSDEDGGQVDDGAQWWHIYSRQRDANGTRTRVMPFLYSHEETPDSESSSYLLGLLGNSKTPTHSSRRALPLYYRSQSLLDGEVSSSTTAFFPFYIRQQRPLEGWDKQSFLFPLYSLERSETDTGSAKTHSLLGGLGLVHRSDTRRETRLWPLFGSNRYESGESAVSVSLLYRSHDYAGLGETDRLWSEDGYLGMQLYRTASGANTRTTVLNPFLYGYHRDDRTEHLQWNVLGFNRYQRDGDTRSYTALGLINGRRTSESSWDSFFPLYYSADRGARSLDSVTFPSLVHLFSRQRNNHESRWSLLGILASGSTEANGDGSFRILHRGVAFLRDNGRIERTIEPLVTYEYDQATGSRYFSLLKLLYISSQASASAPVERRVLGVPLPF